MRILVVGGGAREHTLVWKLAQSPKVTEIFAAPGNAGTAQIAKNLPIAPTDIAALVKAARKKRIDLVVVGPETSLAAGLVDRCIKEGIPIFGPTQAATEIESSKAFAKELMESCNIPCASGKTFLTYLGAKRYLVRQKPPIVIKADGLAAGKGVVVAQNLDEASKALYEFMIQRTLDDAGRRVIIEEYLFGREVSVFAFVDGEIMVPMVPACDYKRVYDNDRGPNTGGMGSYSPPEFLNGALIEQIRQDILLPTVNAIGTERGPFQGVLYGGLMITFTGPKVLEINARLGDPETQVILPRLKTDLVDIIMAVVNGTLNKTEIEWSNDVCVGVVMASEGYPAKPITGREITGLADVDEDMMVFHAGTEMKGGHLLTSGGRVLTVVATGKTLAEAREKVYDNISRIHFQGCHHRKDIALRAIDA